MGWSLRLRLSGGDDPFGPVPSRGDRFHSVTLGWYYLVLWVGARYCERREAPWGRGGRLSGSQRVRWGVR